MGKTTSFLQNKEFLITVYLQKARKLDDESIEIIKKERVEKITALIDTGATTSVISEKIAKKLELEKSGDKFINTVSSVKDRVKAYKVLFNFPVTTEFIINSLKKEEFFQNDKVRLTPIILISYFSRVLESKHIAHSNIDVVMGMDILQKTHLTINDGKLVISF